MDFWVGVWDVRWEDTPDFGIAAGNGINRITRELNDCVIREQFEGGPSTDGLVGHSVSMYHAAIRRWRQTWVDNQGSYFALVGGLEDARFVLTNARFGDQGPLWRMVYEDITPESLTWRWQRSADGEAWTDTWVIRYRRKAP